MVIQVVHFCTYGDKNSGRSFEKAVRSVSAEEFQAYVEVSAIMPRTAIGGFITIA